MLLARDQGIGGPNHGGTTPVSSHLNKRFRNSVGQMESASAAQQTNRRLGAKWKPHWQSMGLGGLSENTPWGSMGLGNRVTSHNERPWDRGAERQATLRDRGTGQQRDKPNWQTTGLANRGVKPHWETTGLGSRVTNHSDRARDWGAGWQAIVIQHGTVEQSDKPHWDSMGLGSRVTSNSEAAWD
jgi:hypothetical protein